MSREKRGVLFLLVRLTHLESSTLAIAFVAERSSAAQRAGDSRVASARTPERRPTKW
jgi:hypothetical protein